MKISLIILAFIFLNSCFAQRLQSLDLLKTTQNLEPVESLWQSKLMVKHDVASKTKDALLSYPLVLSRANFLARKLQKITLGEYAETAAYLAPFITGEVSAKILDFNLLLNFNEGNGKIVYSYKF